MAFLIDTNILADIVQGTQWIANRSSMAGVGH